MRKRVAYITFPEKEGSNADLLGMQKKLAGLNIRFGVQIYLQSGVSSQANIDVYNLNRDDLEFLSTTVKTLAQKQNLVQLYAGYEGDVQLLFSGQVFEGTPQGYPDVILKIRGLSDMKWQGVNLELQKSDFKVIDLIDRAGKEMGYPVNIDSNLRNNNPLLNKSVEDWSYTGSPIGLLEKAQEMLGGVSADPQTVAISVSNGQINVWSPSVQNQERKLVISKESGMIGLPRPTGTGCSVTILMNNGIKPGDLVSVRSERVKILNGDYYVMGITHEGELRGRNWYSTLELANVSNFKSNANG